MQQIVVGLFLKNFGCVDGIEEYFLLEELFLVCFSMKDYGEIILFSVL